jgi:hypothetical protein
MCSGHARGARNRSPHHVARICNGIFEECSARKPHKVDFIVKPKGFVVVALGSEETEGHGAHRERDTSQRCTVDNVLNQSGLLSGKVIESYSLPMNADTLTTVRPSSSPILHPARRSLQSDFQAMEAQPTSNCDLTTIRSRTWLEKWVSDGLTHFPSELQWRMVDGSSATSPKW